MVKPKYYLVERTLLPEVFQRVIEANEAIASGKAATASEAAKIAGLSRSAYYKYKDGVQETNMTGRSFRCPHNGRTMS